MYPYKYSLHSLNETRFEPPGSEFVFYKVTRPKKGVINELTSSYHSELDYFHEIYKTEEREEEKLDGYTRKEKKRGSCQVTW